jgi:uncharacterized protein GlcG (DUF336 family)
MNLALAQEIVDRARQEAERQSLNLSFAVVDPGGRDVVVARMDGAGFLTVEVARSKAFTSAGSQVPTAVVQQALSEYPHLLASFPASTQTRFIAVPGGLPITVDGEIVGALGVSGGTAEQDLSVAEAGLAAVAAP